MMTNILFSRTFRSITGALFSFALVGSATAETLRLGLNQTPMSVEVQAAEFFAETVEEMSGGDITVDVFEGDKLGAPVSQIENLQLGTQDMHGNVSDWLQQLDKDWATLAMPFLFSGIEHVQAFQETDVYAAMQQRLIDEHGVRMIADNWYRLPKVLVTTRPVFTPEDLAGMKLRMPDLATYVDTWSAFGARPTPLAWGEAYLAMRTGTVEGMDSPLNLVYPQKFYEAAPFILRTDHLVAPYMLLISETTWQGLSPEQQQIVGNAATQAGVYYSDLVQTSFAEQREAMLAEGTSIIEIDAAPFAALAEDVMRSFEDEGRWSDGMVDMIRGLN